MTKPIIVGIDPGTTCAWAFLDMQGELLEINSSKELDLSSLILKSKEHGLPIIVSSDKENTPEFVKQFSTKTGARLVSIKNDMPVNDKREITKSYNTTNSHERDALASALFAHKKFHVIFKKIKKFSQQKNKENLLDKITFLVITKEVSMALALNMIEETGKEISTVKNIIEKEELNVKKQKYTKLLEKYYWAIEENTSLRIENKELRKDLKNEKVEKNKLNEILRNSNHSTRPESQEIKRLKKLAQNIKKEKIKLQNELEIIKETLDKSKDYIVCKRVNKLGKEDLEEYLIQDGDVLYVEDPSSFSPSILDYLKQKAIKIIPAKKTKVSRTLKNNLTVIEPKNIKIKKTKYFIFVEKSQFYEAIEKRAIIKKLINEYRDIRENEKIRNSP